MLKQLIEESRQATSLSECCRSLIEITSRVRQTYPPYEMQTGRRGGRFYVDNNQRRHYRELEPGERRGGSSASSAPRKKSREQLNQEWAGAKIKEVNPRTGREEGEGFPSRTNFRNLSSSLWSIFGEKAPSPKEFAEMFSSQGIKAEVTGVSASGGDHIRVSYNVKDQDGTSIGGMDRSFYKDHRGPHVHHDLFTLEDEAQGGGRGGAMFGKALDTYKKMGIAVASVMAAITVGPYAWARFGFQPDSSQMGGIREDFKTFLQKPPIGLSRDEAESITRRHGETVHKMSGVTLQVDHLNPKTGETETKTIKAGKDFFLYSQGGNTRGWTGEADLRKPEVVARWEEQSSKGVKTREKAIAEGTQNARNGSPAAVVKELNELGDRELARKLSAASAVRLRHQSPSPWNSAIDALTKAAKDNPSKRHTYNSMLKRLKPFHDRVKTRYTYTRDGVREFEAQQRQGRVARSQDPTVRARAAAQLARDKQAARARQAAAPRASAAAPDESIFAQRAARFGTTPDQEREVNRLSYRRINAEETRRQEIRRVARRWGDPEPSYNLSMSQYANRERRIVRGQMQAELTRAASQAARERETARAARHAAQRAATPAPAPAPARRAPASTPAVSPQAPDLIRKGRTQTRAAATPAPAPAPAAAPAAPAKPEPATPEKRAALYGTTVAQEKRFDRIADRKGEAYLLRRREVRALARSRNQPEPEFIPIRVYKQQIRATHRAAVLRNR